MKKIIATTIGCLILITYIVAGDSNKYNSYHGFNSFLSETGSGYGLSNNLNLYVQEFNRVFELGLILNVKEYNISGFEFTYKHFLGFRSAHLYSKPLKPFICYNFIYRLPATIINPVVIKSASGEVFGTSKIISFEHYIGIGAQLKLIKQFYFETSTGFGIYLGSRYQGAAPKTWGIHLNNHGYIPSVKMGLGLQF